MSVAPWCLILAAGLAAPTEPLRVSVARERDALEVRVELLAPLPDTLQTALPSGAQVRVVYPLRLRVRRSFVWDRRLWKGEITASVAFDPVVGRYRCELVLDRVIVATRETDSSTAALVWLRSPPAVRLDLPAERRSADLLVRVRAVFASATRWLLFPSVEGTDWVEVRLEGGP
jgi:hypothetical protein